VKPKVAIYSCGLGNSYGHPAAVTLSNLAAAGSKVHGTDVNGIVIVTSNATATRSDGEQAGWSPSAATQTNSHNQKANPSSSGSVAISLGGLTSPVRRGAGRGPHHQDHPGSGLHITVKYKSGPSHAAGLDPQTAGDDGTVTWSWKVGSSTTPGTWSIVVTSTAGARLSPRLFPSR